MKKTKHIVIDPKMVQFLPQALHDGANLILNWRQFEEAVQAWENHPPQALLWAVDLLWDKGNSRSFAGYELFYSRILLKNIISPPIRLAFVSSFSKAQLVETDTNPNTNITRCFCHFGLNSLPGDWIDIPCISERKWNYFLKYYFTKYGIVDSIEHVLRRLQPHNQASYQSFLTDIKHYLSLRPVLGHDTITHLHLLREAIATGQNSQEILLRLASTKAGLAALKDEGAPKPETGPLKTSMLLVEDKEAERLKQFFEKYVSKVQVVTTSEEAIVFLQQGSSQFQALVTDMELLDSDGFAQNLQGIDLLDHCRQNHPTVATRIVSGLPKVALSQLVAKPSEHILYKDSESPSGLALAQDFSSFFSKLHEEIKARSAFMAQRPVLGPWAEPTILNWYFEWREKGTDDTVGAFETCWEEVVQMAEDFQRRDQNMLSVSIELPSANTSKNLRIFKGYVKQILTHRLLVLAESICTSLWDKRILKPKGHVVFAYDQRGEGDYDNGYWFYPCFGIREEPIGAPENKIKTYLNTGLGLSYQSLSPTEKRAVPKELGAFVIKKISYSNLFPEEIEFIKKWEPELALTLREEFNQMYKTLSENWDLPIMGSGYKLSDLFHGQHVSQITATDFENALKEMLEVEDTSFRDFAVEVVSEISQHIDRTVEARLPRSLNDLIRKVVELPTWDED